MGGDLCRSFGGWQSKESGWLGTIMASQYLQTIPAHCDMMWLGKQLNAFSWNRLVAMAFRFGYGIVGFKNGCAWVLNSLLLILVVMHFSVNMPMEEDYAKGMGLSLNPDLS